ncbi:MAG TPA: methyltransferase domain-containing protein [Galbitalea sp.]|nr:methyltransferase domain-containing protein [Galbitalea sp.]
MTGLETPEQVAARYDGRAATYDDDDPHHLIARAVAEFVDPTGVRDVLDAATGTGLVLRALKLRLAEDARLTGVDLSARMLEVARAQTPDATFLVGDATALPWEDGSFDLVTCVTAIHLMPDTDVALREWSRVLRPAGRIVIATFTTVPGWGHLVSVADEAPAAGLTVLRSIGWRAPAEADFPELVIAELARG